MASSIKYESKQHITGRGTIYVVDTSKVGHGFRIGNKIIFDDKEFQICGIERTMKLMDPPLPGSIIGILVRPWLPEAH